MQIIFRPERRGNSGFALIITMIFLAVALVLFGSMMYWVSSNVKVTIRNNQYNMSSGAAEGAVERVLAQMDRDFLSQSLTDASYYATLSIPTNNNWTTQYVFSDTNGIVNQIGVYLGAPATNTVPLDSQYSGLYGLAQDCLIVARATPVAQSGVTAVSVPATVREYLQFASIPLFQFAIFYNINLEIDPSQPMTVTGPVFSNAGLWSGSGIVSYTATVTAVGTADHGGTDPYVSGKTDVGTPNGNFAYPPISSASALKMPIGTNNDPIVVRAILGIPPSAYANGTAAAYTTNGLNYVANGADLIISNTISGTNSSAPSGTNFFVFYQDPTNAPYLTLVTPDYYNLKTGGSTNYVSTNSAAGIYSSTNVQYASYTFLTNALFYDWREGWNGGSGIGSKGKPVQAVQIDVSKFNIWVTNTATNGGSFINANYNGNNITDKGHPIDSMYVYNAVPPTSTTLPAVRVVNGAQLGSLYGFTVATPFPMYVKGNYNTHDSSGTAIQVNSPSASYHAWPAALMADSVTILSSAWDDSQTSQKPGPSASITVNAALLEGIVQSNGANYSGGVENFLRFLEDWGGNPVYYNGSIVVMFPSQYATNNWNGGYYGVPTRRWAFDTNFRNQSGLPPLTPETKAVIRSQWLAQ
jgi:hypothetical protein